MNRVRPAFITTKRAIRCSAPSSYAIPSLRLAWSPRRALYWKRFKQLLQERNMTIEDGVVAGKKVAIVTGGSRGIGKDIALALARMGIGIVLTYHSNKTEGERVAEEIQASGVVAVALQLDVATTSGFDT